MALPANVPASGRFTPRVVAAKFKLCKAADAAAVLSMIFVGDGVKKSLRGTCQAKIVLTDNSVALYDLADLGGKVHVYGDVDSPVKILQTAAQVASMPVVVQASGVWDAPIPSDLVKARAAERVKLIAAKAKNTAEIATIDAQLALMVGWETGTIAQQARKAEENAKRATVVADSAQIDARVAEIDAG